MSNTNKKFAAAFALLLLTVVLLSGTVLAAGKIDTEHPAVLTLRFFDGENAISGASFSLYRAADTDAYERMTLTEAFAAYEDTVTGMGTLSGMDQGGWKELARTLYGAVLRDRIPADAKGTTGRDGLLQLDDLTPGLYLVSGSSVRAGDYSYQTSPFLIFLPGLDEEANEWVYDVTVDLKFSRTRIPDPVKPPETVTRKVLKVWDDKGCENVRPQSISVTLWLNGKAFDTVELNEKNNWKHTWNGLPKFDANFMKNCWEVTEETVDGYTVLVEQEGVTFKVTNTVIPEIPEEPEGPEEPEEPEEPEIPEEPEKPEPPKEPEIPEIPEEPKQPELPQTGLLWWPVPVCLLLGVGLLTTGIFLRTRRED